MEIRYLSSEDKNKTRPLWESIFPEDCGAFLDYYYSVKTKDNEILVLEKDGVIRSMLQLNPYRLQIGAAQAKCAYVIAVATDENYRHQGMMKTLLEQAMRDRYERKQPFLFLIPADEAIYRPFGFRFVYRQQYRDVYPENVTGAAAGQELQERSNNRPFHLCAVAVGEEAQAASYANDFLSEHHREIFAVRDTHYCEVLRSESEAEDGTLAWIMHSDSKIGLLSYTVGDEGIDIREPILKAGYEYQLDEILGACFEQWNLPLHIYGVLPELSQNSKSTIMIRPLYLPSLFAGIRAEEELEFILRVHDPILDENNGVFVWHVSPEESSFGTEWMSCRQGLDLDVSVEALAQLLTGFSEIDEIVQKEHCIMTPAARKKWEKIRLLNHVFLNEVV